MGNPVNWFEIPVTDLERAVAFYRKVFGSEFQMMDMFGSQFAFFHADMAVYGIGGALVKSDGYEPSAKGVVVYFMVEDIDATNAAIAASGGRTLFPKTPIGEFGWVSHVLDTEGNRIGLHTPPAAM